MSTRKSVIIKSCIITVTLLSICTAILYLPETEQLTFCSLPSFILKNGELEKYQQILIDSQALATSQVYYEESISEEALAFTSLLCGNISLEEKRRIFCEIFRKSQNPSGQLYSLTALHVMNRAEYRKLKRKLNRNQKVYFLFCDVSSRDSMDYILKLLEEKSFLLKNLIVEPALLKRKAIVSVSQNIPN